METTERPLSHTESLQIIQNMIATAKNNVSDDGFHFLLWGFLVIAASIANYLLAVMDFANNSLPWAIMPLVGVPLAFIYEWRKSKHEKVTTHFDKIFGYLWLGVGVTLFMIIYISVKNQLSPIPFILALVGMGTFVSGKILKFNALIFGSVVFWASAMLACYASPAYQLLINAVATFIGYIIPGVLLWRNYKAQNNV